MIRMNARKLMETFAKLLYFQPIKLLSGEAHASDVPQSRCMCDNDMDRESRRLQTDSNVDVQWRNCCGAQDADQVCTFHRRTIILVSPQKTPACSFSPLHPERDAPPRHARILRPAPSAPPGCSFVMGRRSRCTSLPYALSLFLRYHVQRAGGFLRGSSWKLSGTTPCAISSCERGISAMRLHE
jgi:hypothetical protein